MPAADTPVHHNLLPRMASFAGVHFREDTLYTNASGIERRRIRNRVEKDLPQVVHLLTRILRPDEVVLYVARGAEMPGNIEQILSAFVHVTDSFRTMLVFTNIRLLALRTRTRALRGWVWDRGIFAVEWNGLVQARIKGWLLPYMELTDRNGRKERFFRLRHLDATKIKHVMAVLTGAVGPTVEPNVQAYSSLCPECFATLAPAVYRCAQCGMTFRNEKSLLARALFIPGGAYLYTGRIGLGVFSGLLETVGLLDVIRNFVTLAHTVPGVVNGDTPQSPLTDALIALSAVLLLKVAAIYRSKRQVRKFIPA